jgi:hypothetical protein
MDGYGRLGSIRGAQMEEDGKRLESEFLLYI